MSSPTSNFTQEERARRLARATSRAGSMRAVGLLAALAGLGLVGYFFIQAGVLVPPAPQNVKSDVVIANPELATGQKARINGFDRNNHPYEITATSGVQDKVNKDLVHLDGMTAKFIRPQGENLNVASDQAHYDSKTKQMVLDGNVVLDQGQKFKATMAKASVNTVDQTLQSLSPVVVEAKGGVIRSESLTVTENGERVIFKGGVKAHFGGN